MGSTLSLSLSQLVSLLLYFLPTFHLRRGERNGLGEHSVASQGQSITVCQNRGSHCFWQDMYCNCTEQETERPEWSFQSYIPIQAPLVCMVSFLSRTRDLLLKFWCLHNIKLFRDSSWKILPHSSVICPVTLELGITFSLMSFQPPHTVKGSCSSFGSQTKKT